MDKIVLITDALKPTEQAIGPLYANGDEVVFRDGIFYRKTDDVIAGSALTIIRGIKNLVSFGFSIEEAVKTASVNPAQVMRYRNKGIIMPGYDADLVVFDRNFKVLTVVAGGILMKNLLDS